MGRETEENNIKTVQFIKYNSLFPGSSEKEGFCSCFDAVTLYFCSHKQHSIVLQILILHK